MVSIQKLQQDKQNKTVSVGDQIFLAFLEYAGTTLEELLEADRRETLKATCEAASNEITEEIFQFWSQNNALEVVIDIDSLRLGAFYVGRPRHLQSLGVSRLCRRNRSENGVFLEVNQL